MNIYSLESFITFCDDMMIAEEKTLFGKLGLGTSSTSQKIKCGCCGRKPRMMESFEDIGSGGYICKDCTILVYKIQDAFTEKNKNEYIKNINLIKGHFKNSSPEFRNWFEKDFIPRHNLIESKKANVVSVRPINIGNRKILMAKVDIKLNNNDIEIPGDRLPISLPTIMEAVNAVQKEFPKILDSIANDMCDYAKDVVDHTSDLAHSISRYRRVQDLKKDLIPQGPFEYEYYEKYKIGQFSLTYDTTPCLDPNHVYTKFVEYNFNTRKVTYNDYSYDG